MHDKDTRTTYWMFGAAILTALVVVSGEMVNPLTAPASPEEGVVLTSWWVTAAMSVWFCVSVTLWVMALRSPGSRLASVVRRIAMPGARKFAESTFALTLMVSSAACSVGAGTEAPTLSLVATHVTTEALVAPTTVPTPTTSGQPSDPDTTTKSDLTTSSTAPEMPEATAEVSEPSDGAYEVLPGDNLWSIASAAVTEELGHQATSGEIVVYWKELVTLNRNNILSGHPDLIYPGEVVLLPTSE